MAEELSYTRRGRPACPGITPRWAGYHPRPLRYHCCENLWAFPPFVMTIKFTVLAAQRTCVPLAQKRIHYKTTPSLVEHQPRRLYASSFELVGNGTVRHPLGRLELPDPPIRLRAGVLHSRVVGIDVEVNLCSCFREA